MKRKFLLTQILYLVVLFEAGFTFSGTHCTYKNWFLTSVIASWEWRHRRMLEISNLEKRSKKGVALKHGQGSTYYDIKWVKAAFSSTLARKALFFFLFLPGVPIWFKSADGLASSLGSSSVLLVQNESATIMPARMCLTFCAQTLVPTQTIRRLSHLDSERTPCSTSSLSMEPETEAVFLGLHILLEKPKLAKPHDVRQKLAQLEIALHMFFQCPPTVPWDRFAFVSAGRGPLDFKPQLNKNAFI